MSSPPRKSYPPQTYQRRLICGTGYVSILYSSSQEGEIMAKRSSSVVRFGPRAVGKAELQEGMEVGFVAASQAGSGRMTATAVIPVTEAIKGVGQVISIAPTFGILRCRGTKDQVLFAGTLLNRTGTKLRDLTLVLRHGDTFSYSAMFCEKSGHLKALTLEFIYDYNADTNASFLGTIQGVLWSSAQIWCAGLGSVEITKSGLSRQISGPVGAMEQLFEPGDRVEFSLSDRDMLTATNVVIVDRIKDGKLRKSCPFGGEEEQRIWSRGQKISVSSVSNQSKLEGNFVRSKPEHVQSTLAVDLVKSEAFFRECDQNPKPQVAGKIVKNSRSDAIEISKSANVANFSKIKNLNQTQQYEERSGSFAQSKSAVDFVQPQPLAQEVRSYQKTSMLAQSQTSQYFGNHTSEFTSPTHERPGNFIQSKSFSPENKQYKSPSTGTGYKKASSPRSKVTRDRYDVSGLGVLGACWSSYAYIWSPDVGFIFAHRPEFKDRMNVRNLSTDLHPLQLVVFHASAQWLKCGCHYRATEWHIFDGKVPQFFWESLHEVEATVTMICKDRGTLMSKEFGFIGFQSHNVGAKPGVLCVGDRWRLAITQNSRNGMIDGVANPYQVVAFLGRSGDSPAEFVPALQRQPFAGSRENFAPGARFDEAPCTGISREFASEVRKRVAMAKSSAAASSGSSESGSAAAARPRPTVAARLFASETDSRMAVSGFA